MNINFNAYYEMNYSNREKYYNKSDYSTWCKNHVFVSQVINDKVFMVDTFWGGKKYQANSYTIEQIDEKN